MILKGLGNVLVLKASSMFLPSFCKMFTLLQYMWLSLHIMLHIILHSLLFLSCFQTLYPAVYQMVLRAWNPFTLIISVHSFFIQWKLCIGLTLTGSHCQLHKRTTRRAQNTTDGPHPRQEHLLGGEASWAPLFLEFPGRFRCIPSGEKQLPAVGQASHVVPSFTGVKTLDSEIFSSKSLALWEISQQLLFESSQLVSICVVSQDPAIMA